MKTLSSERLRGLLRGLRNLLLNRHVWYLLMLIPKAFKYLEEDDECDE